MLAQKDISMKVKDFYACNNFFKTIVQAHIIALCIYYQGVTKINDLQILLSRKNWLDIMAQIEKQYFSLEKVEILCNKSGIDIFVDVATNLNA